MSRFCRAIMTLVASLALALVMTSFVQAQPRHGFGVDVNFLPLLRIEKVQIELKLNDKQKAHIEKIQQSTQKELQTLLSGLSLKERGKRADELRRQARRLVNEGQKKVSALLNESQQKRLQQITIQVYKTFALRDKKIAKQIGLSDGQYKKIVGYWDEHLTAIPKLFQAVRDGSLPRSKLREKRDQLRKQTADKLISVLTDAQKEKFETLKGKKFDLDAH